MNCIFLLDYTFQKKNKCLNPTEGKNTFLQVHACKEENFGRVSSFPKTHTTKCVQMAKLKRHSHPLFLFSVSLLLYSELLNFKARFILFF